MRAYQGKKETFLSAALKTSQINKQAEKSV